MTIWHNFEFSLLLRSKWLLRTRADRRPRTGTQQRLYVLYVGMVAENAQRASVRGIPSCFSLRSLGSRQENHPQFLPNERETGSARNDRLVISEGLPCGTEWRRRTDRFWERMRHTVSVHRARLTRRV